MRNLNNMGHESEVDNFMKDERLTDAIGEEGLLLQEKCALEMAKTPWSLVEAEYPAGLKIKNVDPKLLETSIDLISKTNASVNGDIVLVAVVQCKRAWKGYKSWVFFTPNPKSAQPINANLFTISYPSVNGTDIVRDIDGQEIINIDRNHVRMPRELTELENCYYGYEVMYDKNVSHKNDPIRRSETIQEACLKTQTSFLSLYKEEKIRQIKSKNRATTLLFPIIITTADLIIPVYNPEDVDIKSGKLLPEKIEFKKVKWLIYESPLREYIFSRSYADYQILSLKERKKQKVMPIFIVNSSYIIEFFTKLRHVG